MTNFSSVRKGLRDFLVNLFSTEGSTCPQRALVCMCVSKGMGGGFLVVIITEGCSGILWAGAKMNAQNSLHNKELPHH